MNDLQQRTKQFAIDVFRFCDTLPNQPAVWVISKQLMRSASSVGANYRAACHARSRAEFLSKMSIVEEEADESQFWLEMLQELELGCLSRLPDLHQAASELTGIVIASIKTARKNQHAS
jgi:four helix bundle protein